MELFLIFIFSIWISLVIFYALYLAAINLWDNRNETSKWVLIAASPVLIAMILIDFLMQVTIFTVVFMDLPRETMVTYRLRRYREQKEADWRTSMANHICTKALNPFDPTKHHC